MYRYVKNRETMNTHFYDERKQIPNHAVDCQQYSSRLYNSQFTADGNYCFVSTQDHKIIFYDTSDISNFKKMFSFKASFGQWTITDYSISNNNRFMAYSSLVPYIHLAEISQDGPQRVVSLSDADDRFAVWCVKFSADNREIIAGTNDCCIYVYDIESNQVVEKIEGHDGDVNAVAFVDPTDTNVIVSGSDDTTIKVWDRRSMANQACSGYLIGHTEGITYLSPKGDGRHILSNAKDQLKSGDYDPSETRLDFVPPWDYRWMAYPLSKPAVHPDDVSIRTFTGHSVLRTLIRCYFSPLYSTSQSYAYTGSADGIIHVYSLLGDEVYTIDSKTAEFVDAGVGYRGRQYDDLPLVRDLSWHPFASCLIASQWSPTGGNLLKFEPDW